MFGKRRMDFLLLSVSLGAAGWLTASEPPKSWTVEDFDAVISVGLEGYRDYDNGRRGFTRGTCVKCHRFAGEGPEDGVDLARSGERRDPRSLLAIVLSPRHPADREGASRRYRVEPAKGGYLDAFAEEDVLDLLAYLVSGGDAKDPAFAK